MQHECLCVLIDKILLIINMIIFSFLGFILARKIYRIHKIKHANIIDDEFEYNTQEQKYKKASTIEMTKKVNSEE